MCIILDANCMTDFLNKHEAMQPVHDWLMKKGKLAYTTTDKFKEGPKKFLAKIIELNRAGKLKRFSEQAVEKQQRNIPEYQSDDPHIIALGLVAKVKVLVSYDKKLHKDFKTINRGRIYQDHTHQHLLTNDLCP